MSAVKFECPPYKLYEPDYHPQKPIIVGVDERLESPETLTIRYEEAARAANGGDPREDSPRLLEMAAYGKAQLPSMHDAEYDAARYQDAAYEQYPTQSFPAQQQADKFAQLNQQAFASNNAVAQYIPTGPPVVSFHPSSGVCGTKVFIKISSHYDIFGMSSPYFFLVFGSQRCPVSDVSRDSQDTSGFTYTCTVDAPQQLVTGSSSSNVPLSLVVEGHTGEERTVVGSFQYLEGSADDITRTAKIPKHDTAAPAQAVGQPSTSPKAGEPQLPTDAPTNTYEYPPQQGQYGSTFAQGNNDMITTYRTTSFTDPQYHRRSGGWSAYPSTLGSTGRSPALDSMSGRPGMTALSMPSSAHSGTPQLIRTSTIASGAGGNGPYHPMSLYSSKAVLKIVGKLDSMAENWTQEEWESRRRIVVFRKSQAGSTLSTTFRAVPLSERQPNSICVSCIWWAEKGECFVTSVDTIHLLEQLVAAPSCFSVEEKNRIRRNLEGFHPLTVSKAKAESEEFFKLIMAFPNPKPRNIEKDVKVFPWKILEPALKKIIGKYSASPSSTLPPSNMVTPVPAAYAPLPTPPGHGMGPAGPSEPHGSYPLHSHPQHHESIPSPRSLPGCQPPWGPYASSGPAYSTAPSRTLSPSLRHSSPQQAQQTPLRITTTALPAVTTYDTRTVSTGGYGTASLHTPIGHSQSNATPPRWDTASASYSEGYPSLPAHHAQTSQGVYNTGAYGEGGPRA